MGNYRVPYLTDMQERIMRCIRERITDEGEAPTVAEIAATVQRTPSTVHYQLAQIADKGFILREPKSPRGITLLR